MTNTAGIITVTSPPAIAATCGRCLPVAFWARTGRTFLVPLVVILATETGADMTRGLRPRGHRLALSRPVVPSHRDGPRQGIPLFPSGRPNYQSGLWLRNAAAGLCVLAAASAAVSFTAQYRLVDATRQLPVVAGLEAAIPDAAALVFACLGVALALQGRRAVRARALNLAAVGASVFMNAIAAGPGWRDLAIWVLPPAAYALASDTLIGVVRAWALARHRQGGLGPDPDETTPLAVLAALLLWLLRLAVAPASTLAGFRAWVLAECPVAPRRRAHRPVPSPGAVPGPGAAPPPRKVTKTGRFLDLVAERHGVLAEIPLHATAQIAAVLAPQVGLHAGAARAALRKAVLAALADGDPR